MLRNTVFGSLLAIAVCAACSRTPEPPPPREVEMTSPVTTAAFTPASAPALTPPPPASAAAIVSASASPSHTASKIKHVIVIAMENHDAEEIYQDADNAPYLHSLLERYAHAENFDDELPLEIPSEGHYVWMEAGTHHFSDALFDDDSPPSSAVSTGSTKHLVNQIKNANNGVSWMTYQEGMNADTGACPIQRSGFYVPKHNPFVFFRDVSGDPPAKDAPYCAAHHKPYSALKDDLSGELASYVFITPDECHDMHSETGCPEENPIRTGDRWLKAELPRLIEYADKHAAVIFLTFDEGGSTPKLPFLAIGSMVKPHYAGTERYNHSSQLKSVELILGLALLPTVSSTSDLSDLFKPGAFP
jgi:phosphatidylinositol-3-phosphatase